MNLRHASLLLAIASYVVPISCIRAMIPSFLPAAGGCGMGMLVVLAVGSFCAMVLSGFATWLNVCYWPQMPQPFQLGRQLEFTFVALPGVFGGALCGFLTGFLGFIVMGLLIHGIRLTYLRRKQNAAMTSIR